MSMIPYKDFIASDEKDNIWKPRLFEFKKKRKTFTASDDIICFDTEVCNFYVDPAGKVYSIKDIFKYCNNNPEAIENCFSEWTPGALPYIWQCSINDWVLYGRELPEFKGLLKYIRKKLGGAEAHIWIHNISYEYTFLREIINFTRKFFTEARKPLMLEYHNLTFRCSHRLTMMSLAKWGEQIGVPKATGDLDYLDLYTPLQPLTFKQMGYCEQDLRVMIKGIRNYLTQYDHIRDIPFTQTGIPRRDIKIAGKAVRGWQRKCSKMQPRTVEDWKVLHATYCGGLTLCNPDKAGYVIQCHTPGVMGYINVGTEDEPVAQRSVDRKSAYPAAMLEKYPSSEFLKVGNEVNWNDGNHHICLVEFINMKARYDVTPQSSSKRIMISGAKYNADGLSKNNGKVITCARFALYITEVDKALIDLYYTYDAMIVHSHRVALSDYMPKHVLDYMLLRYEAKTLRKTDVDQTLYNLEKQKLNSIYGMMGTSLIHDDIIEEGWEFVTKFKNDAEILKDLKRLQDFDYSNVLPYSWGIYVTSHQRYALMSTALELEKDPDGVLRKFRKMGYSDTDSLKGSYTLQDMKKVDQINQRIIEWTKQRCEEQGIDYSKTCPCDADGNPQHLGTWENDANYYEIKYLGAKRYAYRKTPNDIIHITIAGVPKSAGNVLECVDDLKEGLTFDLFQSRKNLCQYIDGDNPQIVMPDGYKVTNKCGCIIRPTSYTLTLENEYRQLIKYYISQKQH